MLVKVLRRTARGPTLWSAFCTATTTYLPSSDYFLCASSDPHSMTCGLTIATAVYASCIAPLSVNSEPEVTVKLRTTFCRHGVSASEQLCTSQRMTATSGYAEDAGEASHSFFFFQAEDGIRDYKVTGVQTCALPI